MPRTSRVKSGTGIYHIIIRGINRQTIFKDNEDAIRFLQTLEKYQEKDKFILYAYCLMNNHVHLLLKEESEDLGIVMKRIGTSYVYWYNWKYERCGHLFQDRYKSEIVEDDQYFLTVLRYIHQNPIKAGIVKELTEYPWSSYREYIGKPKLIDTDFVLDLFNSDKQRAIEQFETFNAIEEIEICLEIDDRKKWKDEEAIELIKNLCLVSHCKELQDMDKAKLSEYLKQILEQGISVRQISRITGLGRWIINNTVES